LSEEMGFVREEIKASRLGKVLSQLAWQRRDWEDVRLYEVTLKRTG